MPDTRSFSLSESLKALNGLRDAAGLPPEQFPVQAFVGRISDEIETLRGKGRTDAEIAELIAEHSSIRISAEELQENYATPEQRHWHGEPPSE